MDYKTHIMLAIDYIENNLKDEIALTDCARVSGYSDYHFIRVFKETTGLTPSDYIRKRRLTEIIKHMAYIFNVWFPQSQYCSSTRHKYRFESYIEESRTFSEKIYIPIEVKKC